MLGQYSSPPGFDALDLQPSLRRARLVKSLIIYIIVLDVILQYTAKMETEMVHRPVITTLVTQRAQTDQSFETCYTYIHKRNSHTERRFLWKTPTPNTYRSNGLCVFFCLGGSGGGCGSSSAVAVAVPAASAPVPVLSALSLLPASDAPLSSILLLLLSSSSGPSRGPAGAIVVQGFCCAAAAAVDAKSTTVPARSSSEF